MAESTQLTPAEQTALLEMMRSHGWRVFLEKFLIPELEYANRHLDDTRQVERDTQVYRGAKRLIMRLVNTLYRWTKLPNPFEAHYEAFMVQVRSEDTEEDIRAPLPTKVSDVPLIARPRRVSAPV